MTILRVCILLLAAVVSWPGTSRAQDARYVLKQTDTGFMRLDSQTGAVAHCRKTQAKWRCRSLTDGASAYRTEIASLKQENLKLKTRIASLERKLERTDGGLELPNLEQIGEMLSFFQAVFQRVMDFARSLDRPPG